MGPFPPVDLGVHRPCWCEPPRPQFLFTRGTATSHCRPSFGVRLFSGKCEREERKETEEGGGDRGGERSMASGEWTTPRSTSLTWLAPGSPTVVPPLQESTCPTPPPPPARVGQCTAARGGTEEVGSRDVEPPGLKNA